MPKGGASSLTPVYAGLREDLDAFLRAFMQLDTIRFVDYKQLFHHRGMIQLFNGRSNSAEIIEVRMDPDASRNFRKLAELLVQERIYDGYMACLKLLEDKALKHVAFIPIHDPSNFKRFYTDEKVTGVSVLTNLNDPLGNMKYLYESDTFSMLGFIHKEYAKMKEKLGFIGCPLPDVQQKIKEIIEQHSQSLEKSLGVDEIINTDHSSEQLSSRGMLRSSIKEQAHAADLKLSRSRRHRSSMPLVVPTDTFDFVRELKPDVKKLKKIKVDAGTVVPVSKVSSEPVSPLKTRRGRNKTSHTVIKEEPSSPEHASPAKKWKRPARSHVFSDSDHLFIHDSLSVSAPLLNKKSELEHNEDFGMEKCEKPNRFQLNEITPEQKPVIGKSALHESIPTNCKIKREPIDQSSAENGSLAIESIMRAYVKEQSHVGEIVDSSSILDNHEEVATVSPLKSILKTQRNILKRHVSFREKDDGQLDTTVYEISSSSSNIACKINEEQKPCSILPEPVNEAQNATTSEVKDDTEFDDRDMFKPLEDGFTDDDLDLVLEDSDDDMMTIDDM
ncbi:hypothetical protein GCK72_005904 [Caenorhabditis remanei]|uniref:Uncharacterized protein n=1 Tax=Caenorhabditis remanei TaxID=31234 RepID=A0A6A5HG15_CAERE|nr:hypothetical protein GCK72_005904 [Caenorhabditis remanei]KAF1765951.1 hypothetical protein GCK72_005904 [Caenorhabditis remanei]